MSDAPGHEPDDASHHEIAPALVIDVITLFPGMFDGAMAESILSRAVASGRVALRIHDLRSWCSRVSGGQADDAPFGGGAGMVLKPDPLFAAVEAITGRAAGEGRPDESIALLAPAGEPFTQSVARRLAGLSRLVLICGRYEGVDGRVREHLCTEALSLGDFVLSGGEPAALAVMDAVVRLVPGVLGNPESNQGESFEAGLLEAPHYTRPASFRDLAVPAVLLSGNHGAVARWRREQSLLLTRRIRPDLIERALAEGRLDEKDRAILRDTDRAILRAADDAALQAPNKEAARCGHLASVPVIEGSQS